MFFNAIAPLLQKGVKFTLQIEAADADLIAVAVHPSTTSKAGHALTAKQFVATAAEFDAEFVDVMAGFASMTRTLSEQLDDARLVSESAAQAAAADAASKSTKKSTSKASVAKPAPSALVGGASDEEADEAGEADGQGVVGSPAAATHVQQEPAQAGFVL